MSPLSCIWTSVCCLIALLLIKIMSAGMGGKKGGKKGGTFFFFLTLKRGGEWRGKYRHRQLQRKFSSAHYQVFDPSWAEVQLDGWRTPWKSRASASRLHSLKSDILKKKNVFFFSFASKSFLLKWFKVSMKYILTFCKEELCIGECRQSIFHRVFINLAERGAIDNNLKTK